MAEHRFDPVVFVFGGLALAAGAIVLTGGELTDQGRILLPGGLIALGLAVLASVARRDPRPAAEVEAPTGQPVWDDHSDLDDLFAPVDEVLTSWSPIPTAEADTPAEEPAPDVRAAERDDDDADEEGR